MHCCQSTGFKLTEMNNSTSQHLPTWEKVPFLLLLFLYACWMLHNKNNEVWTLHFFVIMHLNMIYCYSIRICRSCYIRCGIKYWFHTLLHLIAVLHTHVECFLIKVRNSLFFNVFWFLWSYMEWSADLQAINQNENKVIWPWHYSSLWSLMLFSCRTFQILIRIHS